MKTKHDIQEEGLQKVAKFLDDQIKKLKELSGELQNSNRYTWSVHDICHDNFDMIDGGNITITATIVENDDLEKVVSSGFDSEEDALKIVEAHNEIVAVIENDRDYQIEELRKHLSNYGLHYDGCERVKVNSIATPCSCGFSEVLTGKIKS